MFSIKFNENKSLILSNATKAQINEDKATVMFSDKENEIIAFFKLDEIQGFYKLTEESKVLPFLQPAKFNKKVK